MSTDISTKGGCYCGEIRYQIEGDAIGSAQCHCRECQYVSGGSANVVMMYPEAAFSYSKGSPASFTRSDIDNPVTREFCSDCGTQLLSRSPVLQGAVIVKVGTLDDPSQFKPAVAIWTSDMQSFHHIPEGVPAFEELPPRG